MHRRNSLGDQKTSPCPEDIGVPYIFYNESDFLFTVHEECDAMSLLISKCPLLSYLDRGYPLLFPGFRDHLLSLRKFYFRKLGYTS